MSERRNPARKKPQTFLIIGKFGSTLRRRICRPFVYFTGFGKFHGSGCVHGVRYGVLVEMMMFVVMTMIIAVVATMRVGERSLSMATKTTKQQQQHNQVAEGRD